MVEHNNQPKNGVSGRGGDRVEARWAASKGGTLLYCLGYQNEQQKKNHIKIHGGRGRLPIEHTTTNQKQTSTTVESMNGRFDERDEWGKLVE